MTNSQSSLSHRPVCNFLVGDYETHKSFMMTIEMNEDCNDKASLFFEMNLHDAGMFASATILVDKEIIKMFIKDLDDKINGKVKSKTTFIPTLMQDTDIAITDFGDLNYSFSIDSRDDQNAGGISFGCNSTNMMEIKERLEKFLLCMS